MSCSSWAPEDDFGLRRLEHELVAIEREANHVMTVVLAGSACHRLTTTKTCLNRHDACTTILPTLRTLLTLPTLQLIAARFVW